MNSTRASTVVEKVEAVLALHSATQPGSSLSISAVAKAAGVSRPNLYTRHPDLIARLRSLQEPRIPSRQGSDQGQSLDRIRDENAKLKEINKALLLLNLELRQELARQQRMLRKDGLSGGSRSKSQSSR